MTKKQLMKKLKKLQSEYRRYYYRSQELSCGSALYQHINPRLKQLEKEIDEIYEQIGKD